MEIKGLVRLDMTAEEIEAVLNKAAGLPTGREINQHFNAIDTALANKQDTLEFASDADIEAAFG